MTFEFRIVQVTPFQQNCSIVWSTTSQRGALIDPGGELPRLKAAAAQLGVTVEQILLTHAHIDHAGAAAALAEDLGVPIIGPARGDQFWIDQLAEQGTRFGFAGARAFTPDRWLEDGDTVTVGGDCELAVRLCPGHTPGHVVFYEPTRRVAFVGDVLFAGSIGRTDFPHGDHDALIDAIKQKLWPLGDDVAFVPGHGPMSTFGAERRTNPFVRDR